MLSLSFTYYITLCAELVYPTYASFLALQSADTNDDTQWLTYWVVYAFFSTFESLGVAILGWIPFYYEFKLVFVIWLIHPKFQGARKLYQDYIKPLLVKYGSQINPIFAKADAALNNAVTNHIVGEFDKRAPGLAEQFVKQAQDTINQRLEKQQ